ncbi:cupin domain-containing protein [Catellatospora coxensis]|uniref:Cupin n=1 Tax=Catellatospora coxensis TaxID=310354 RepID=A0A8J3KS84_9ACTN|nr:cupin domain-containing protein [Catellatospora coxensis]GIG06200.1 cupin [Catellatospora coxensis]
MTAGLLLPPGAGRPIAGSGMTMKVGAEQTPTWSMFETVVQPGFDVGAHFHHHAEELFYILEGELDLLAFRPRAGSPTAAGDWRGWESDDGAKVLRGGAGSSMFVPSGVPHAFFNPGPAPARMLFLVTPAGHEVYLQELSDLIGGGRPDQAAIAELRARHDIQQLTPLTPRLG